MTHKKDYKCNILTTRHRNKGWCLICVAYSFINITVSVDSNFNQCDIFD